MNFGSGCDAGFYPNTELYSYCPGIMEGIQTCQSLNKKIIISLGGYAYANGPSEPATYQLTGKQAGIDFANWLWQAYGPYNATYAAAGGLRPFDGGVNGNDGTHIDIDGFDFDIEIPPTGKAGTGFGHFSPTN